MGVEGRKWKACNMTVHTFLLADWLKNLSNDVKFLLESDIKVLIYSGDKDFICNWRGGEAWTNNMQWSGNEEYNKQEYKKWGVEGEIYGEHKEFGNLNFLRVYNAGHMVPMD
jgi:cathepsin A (carboxypeptidase C)